MKCLQNSNIPKLKKSFKVLFSSYNQLLHNQLLEVLIFKLLSNKLKFVNVSGLLIVCEPPGVAALGIKGSKIFL